MISAETALAIAKKHVAATCEGDVEVLFGPPYGVPSSTAAGLNFYHSDFEQPVMVRALRVGPRVGDSIEPSHRHCEAGRKRSLRRFGRRRGMNTNPTSHRTSN